MNKWDFILPGLWFRRLGQPGWAAAGVVVGLASYLMGFVGGLVYHAAMAVCGLMWWLGNQEADPEREPRV